MHHQQMHVPQMHMSMPMQHQMGTTNFFCSFCEILAISDQICGTFAAKVLFSNEFCLLSEIFGNRDFCETKFHGCSSPHARCTLSE